MDDRSFATGEYVGMLKGLYNKSVVCNYAEAATQFMLSCAASDLVIVGLTPLDFLVICHGEPCSAHRASAVAVAAAERCLRLLLGHHLIAVSPGRSRYFL